MNRPLPHIDKTWTLFLDRDGVLNRKIDDDYVRNWSQFEWLPGVLDALAYFTERFGRIIIVTNQRGVGRGLMTAEDLNLIHQNLLEDVSRHHASISAVYYCADVSDEGSTHRKPQPGMAYDAQRDFPEIDFSKSLIAGDSSSDMAFGKSVGMFTVLIGKHHKPHADILFPSLQALAEALREEKPDLTSI